jgi:hypothetical protein
MSFFKIQMFSNTSLVRFVSVARKLLWLTIVLVSCLWSQLVYSSALSDLANSMQPGSWVQLTTTNFNAGDILRPPATGSCTEYADEGYWNPVNNTVMISGSSHPNGGPGVQAGIHCFVKYTESNNTWSNLTVPDTTTVSHEYEHSAIDSAGNFYHRRYHSAEIRKYSHTAQTWSGCTNWGNGTFQVGGALEYFPDRNSLVFLDGDWGVWELSLASGDCTSTWMQRASTIGGGFSPQLTGLFSYHNQSRYSSRCRCIVMGGGNGSRKLYRYNVDGTFAAIADAPVPIAIPQAGSGTIFTVDPVSGLILVWNYSNASTTMYEYDPVLNAWTTISRTSPIFPGPEGGVTETIAVPISTYGVIMLVQAGSSSGGSVYLYRHAAGSGSPTPPPPSDTVAPSIPSSVSAIAASSSQINISWVASTDNVGLQGYKVYRSGAQIGNAATTSYSDSTVSPSTGYTYTVAAYDAAGNTSAQSISVSATTQAGPPPQTSPIGWWKFDEGTGTVASDSSGSGNIGTLLRPTWTTGVLSNALNFNATDNHVRVGGTNLANVNTFTYTAWIYPRSTGKGGYGVIAAKGGTGVGNKRFLTNNSCPGTSTLELTVERASGSASACAVAGSLALNTWQFVAATYTGANGPRIYKNGLEVGYAARTVGSGAEISDGGTNLQIGSWYNTSTGQFDGMIDDVRVYNRVLSQPEIQALYAQVGAIPPPSFDFALSNGGSQSVTQGQSTSNNISINLVAGTGQAVTLSTSGLPSGTVGSYSLASCTPTCSSSLAVATSTSTLTGSYPITVTAAGGGVTKTTGFTLTVTSATAPPPVVGGADFATRCSQPGVIKCVGFDSPAEITGDWGRNPQGSLRGSSGAPTIDASIKASGNGSMRFTIPAGMPGGAAGSFFANFSNDLSVQFGGNTEFYIQWRMKIDNNFYSATQGRAGMKHAITGTGSRPGLPVSSCTDLEIVIQNNGARGYPAMYHSVLETLSTIQGLRNRLAATISNFKMPDPHPTVSTHKRALLAPHSRRSAIAFPTSRMSG